MFAFISYVFLKALEKVDHEKGDKMRHKYKKTANRLRLLRFSFSFTSSEELFSLISIKTLIS